MSDMEQEYDTITCFNSRPRVGGDRLKTTRPRASYRLGLYA